jgi:hypothetical protein
VPQQATAQAGNQTLCSAGHRSSSACRKNSPHTKLCSFYDSSTIHSNSNMLNRHPATGPSEDMPGSTLQDQDTQRKHGVQQTTTVTQFFQAVNCVDAAAAAATSLMCCRVGMELYTVHMPGTPPWCKSCGWQPHSQTCYSSGYTVVDKHHTGMGQSWRVVQWNVHNR